MLLTFLLKNNKGNSNRLILMVWSRSATQKEFCFRLFWIAQFIYSQISFSQKDIDFVEGHTLVKRYHTPFSVKWWWGQPSPKLSIINFLYLLGKFSEKKSISLLRMCFRAAALSGEKYVSNSQYDSHGDTCSSVPLMKESKLTISK